MGGDEFHSGFTQSADYFPEYHGDDGDVRYPSPRRARRFGAAVIDRSLNLAMFFAAALSPVLVQNGWPVWLVVLLAFTPLSLVIAVNYFLLPRWIHASIGELVFGLAQIRTIDGRWPDFSDLRRGALGQKAWTSPAPPPIAVVRRRDIKPDNH